MDTKFRNFYSQGWCHLTWRNPISKRAGKSTIRQSLHSRKVGTKGWIMLVVLLVFYNKKICNTLYTQESIQSSKDCRNYTSNLYFQAFGGLLRSLWISGLDWNKEDYCQYERRLLSRECEWERSYLFASTENLKSSCRWQGILHHVTKYPRAHQHWELLLLHFGQEAHGLRIVDA